MALSRFGLVLVDVLFVGTRCIPTSKDVRRRSWLPSLCRIAAVDDQICTSHERCLPRRQEAYGVRDVLRPTGMTDRVKRGEVFLSALRRSEERRETLGGDPSRRYGVDENALRRRIERKGSRKRHDSA